MCGELRITFIAVAVLSGDLTTTCVVVVCSDLAITFVAIVVLFVI